MRAAEASSQEQHQCVTSNTRVTQRESCPLPPTCSATHLFWKPRPTLHTLQNMVGFQLESELGARKMPVVKHVDCSDRGPQRGSHHPWWLAHNHRQLQLQITFRLWGQGMYETHEFGGSRLLLSIPKPPILLVPIISDQQYSHYNALVSWVGTVRTVA